MTTQKLTPMMAQWSSCKEKAGEALLLFRLGDFYEAFHDDAVTVSQHLDLTLTKRQDIPMCGIPWHASETYIDRLLAKGFSVAIAEQMVGNENDAKSSLMDRQIVRIETPATQMKGSLIQDSSNNLLACVAKTENNFAIAFVDVSTALFFLVETETLEELVRELLRIRPKEVVCSPNVHKEEAFLSALTQTLSIRCKAIPGWLFDITIAHKQLLSHFGTLSLDCFDISNRPHCIAAAAAVLGYLKDTLFQPTCHLKSIQLHRHQKTMMLDRSTMNNLDIFEHRGISNSNQTLFWVLNKTKTPMGARVLRQCLSNPLLDIAQLEERQDSVEALMQFLKKEPFNAEQALLELGLIRDIERLIVRIQTGNAGPRDVSFLAECLRHIAPLQRLLLSITHPSLAQKIASLATLEDLVKLISSTLTDEPPLRISEGNVIRTGVNAQLDELRSIQHNSHQWLLEYQIKLRETLGIKTLKVGFTRAFGYYIEVSRGQSSLMPASFPRRQTLTNAERYISEELKTFEEAVLSAEKKIEGLETALFEELKTSVLIYTQDILETSSHIAQIDLYLSLAQVAVDGNYVRPKVVMEPNIQIVEGRHPVLDQKNALFVPNNLDMKASGPSLLLITGPNMAGKYTYIRQAALLVIMTQIGSFVPAKSAIVGIVDRVFSRIGASDDLSTGQSTFMVEMSETASILHQATPRSMILLDEIGRGTSTYDGISIAWSVCEYLLRFSQENPRTLFATHYYELTQLEQRFQAVRNMTVAISEQASGIKFLYKVVPGKTDRSYGIHVAKLAGLPQMVVERAERVLAELEEKRPRSDVTFIQQELFTITTQKSPQGKKEETPCYEFLKDLDLSKISPLDCFMKLVRFKNTLK